MVTHERAPEHIEPLQTRAVVASLRWPLVAGLAAFATGAGYVGLSEVFPDRSRLDILYMTLQLFTLESGAVPGPVPGPLQWARFLAPAVAAYTAIQALLVLFAEQIERLKMRWLRNHVVVCGLGRKGLTLASSLRRSGERVVVIEMNAESDRIRPCRAEGALVLIGDARNTVSLRAARVRHARHLIAISEDEGVNAEISVRARALCRGRSHPLQCVAQVLDTRLCALLRAQELERPPDESFRLEFFNVYEAGARQLLNQHPGFQARDSEEIPRGHVLVVGLGRLGSTLVLELARRWHLEFKGCQGRLPVMVVDRTADAKAEQLQLRHPHLVESCELIPLEMDFESPEFVRGVFLSDQWGGCLISVAYVCVDHDSLGLALGLALHQCLRAHGVPVVVRTARSGGLASLLEEEGNDRSEFATLHAFDLIGRTCHRELLARVPGGDS